MNDDFIPLLPAAPTPSAPAPAFAPPAPRAPLPTGPNATTPAHQPRLTVRQAGDRITHVIVHCACGEQIELACEHAP
jgi:hypothetical protein